MTSDIASCTLWFVSARDYYVSTDTKLELDDTDDNWVLLCCAKFREINGKEV